MRSLVYTTFIMTLIALYSGCGAANRASAENAGGDMFTAFDNLLAEFKTVVDDKTAGEKLPTLNQSYDELVVAVQGLQVAQQKILRNWRRLSQPY